MLIIIILVFYGFWLFNINKEIKQYRDMEKNLKTLTKRVTGLDREVFGFDTAPICDEEWDEETEPYEEYGVENE